MHQPNDSSFMRPSLCYRHSHGSSHGIHSNNYPLITMDTIREAAREHSYILEEGGVNREEGCIENCRRGAPNRNGTPKGEKLANKNWRGTGAEKLMLVTFLFQRYY